MYSLAYLIMQNKDALLSLPEWAKTLCLVGIVWMFVSSILRKLEWLVGVAVVAAIAYFACTYFGIF